MGVFRGIKAPFSGAQMIFAEKRMLYLALVPFFLNIVLLLLLFYWGYSAASDWVGTWLPEGGGDATFWWDLLEGFIRTVMAIFLFFVFVLIYLSVASIVAAPFNDILSEMAEKRLKGSIEEVPFRLKEFFQDMWRIARQEVRKMLILVMILIVSSVVQLLPIIGSLIYALLNYGSMAFFTGLEYWDFTLDRKRLQFEDKMKYSKKYMGQTLGLGGVTTLLAFIPLFFSFAAVGATILYTSNEEKS